MLKDTEAPKKKEAWNKGKKTAKYVVMPHYHENPETAKYVRRVTKRVAKGTNPTYAEWMRQATIEKIEREIRARSRA